MSVFTLPPAGILRDSFKTFFLSGPLDTQVSYDLALSGIKKAIEKQANSYGRLEILYEEASKNVDLPSELINEFESFSERAASVGWASAHA